jgi:hypothetical protein
MLSEADAMFLSNAAISDLSLAMSAAAPPCAVTNAPSITIAAAGLRISGNLSPASTPDGMFAEQGWARATEG